SDYDCGDAGSCRSLVDRHPLTPFVYERCTRSENYPAVAGSKRKLRRHPAAAVGQRRGLGLADQTAGVLRNGVFRNWRDRVSMSSAWRAGVSGAVPNMAAGEAKSEHNIRLPRPDATARHG